MGVSGPTNIKTNSTIMLRTTPHQLWLQRPTQLVAECALVGVVLPALLWHARWSSSASADGSRPPRASKGALAAAFAAQSVALHALHSSVLPGTVFFSPAIFQAAAFPPMYVLVLLAGVLYVADSVVAPRACAGLRGSHNECAQVQALASALAMVALTVPFDIAGTQFLWVDHT